MNSSKPETQADARGNKKQKRKSSLLALILLLLILLLFLFQWRLQKFSEATRSRQERQSTLDSLRQADSLAKLDSITAALVDSLRNEKLKSVDTAETPVELPKIEPIPRKLTSSSGEKISSAPTITSDDTTLPEPVLVPPPGRFFEKVQVKVICQEPNCTTELRLGDSLGAKQEQPLLLTNSQVLFYRATDSAGNKSAWEKGSYEIVGGGHSCGAHALPVPVAGRQICVDVFEWPNQPNERSKDMVTQAEAERLCGSVGKRLCTVQEWQAACKGEGGARYPYGNRYDPAACVTSQRTAERTGRRERCRSWWGMFDMSGNLWEWTSTQHEERAGYFYASGGAWNTRDASSCQETKFSFFPQNQYTFVGFRCCVNSP